MKRRRTGSAMALAVLASGALATACDVTPPAARANGATISVSELNTQLHALVDTTAGGCLLQLESSQLTAASGQGSGGAGTYSMAFAVQVLDHQVEDLLAQQYAAARGVAVEPTELATARSDFRSTLDGEISAAVQQSNAQGLPSACQQADGTTLTGAQVLGALPTGMSAALVRNEAVDEKLLAKGADLSDKAVAAYYAANPGLFTVDCVSRIVTHTQDQANQVVARLDFGASFAAVAKASSIDTQTAAGGGSLGCNITDSQVKEGLQLRTVTAGKPIGPLQDSSSGDWIVYEVTSQSLEPLSSATSLVRRELLQASGNVKRVSSEIVKFAHRSDVYINPQYGTWKAQAIVAPVAPPPDFLLAAVSGAPPAAPAPSLDLNGGLGTGASGSSGQAGSAGPAGKPPPASNGG